MTDDVFQKLEEKMVLLLSEVERLRKENSILKNEKELSGRKLQDLIALLDAVNTPEPVYVSNLSVVKPIVVQEIQG